jgi:dTDP-4-dehydrorhamnose 3,5-epimerase
MGLFEIQSEHFGGEVKVIQAKGVYPDNRGSFAVSFLKDEFEILGLPTFIREMYTNSVRGVLRGLHFQLNPAMGKLIEVIHGRAFLVTVDIRPYSRTFLQYHSIEISGVDNLMVWAPAGFARGYYTLMDTIVHYKCDANVGGDSAILWNDPDIGIVWPGLTTPILSERDAHARTVAEHFGSL